jgi:drug/metabolite transporter (DMT)-like permease
MSVIQSTSGRPQRRVEGIVPERRLLGIVLVVIGVIVAAGFVSDAFDQFTLLGVSLTCVVAFAMSREYGYGVPAGITGGLGGAVYLISANAFAPQYVPAVFFLSMAAGFAAVWILGLLAVPKERHPWPLAPATILGAIGVAFAAGQPGAIQWVQFAVAAVVVIAGLGLLFRRDHAA